jgi:peptide/nickel transport system ATP-binding protein
MERGQRLTVMGESGCGKSVFAMAVLGILPANAQIRGSIRFQGTDLFSVDLKTLREIRGNQIGYVPQSISTCLNPVLRIRTQVREVLRRSRNGRMHAGAVEDILCRVGLKPDVAEMAPHQLSEGMKGRVLVGLGICLDPVLLIADEPTKGLDPLARNDMVALLKDIADAGDRSLFMITHDLDAARALPGNLAVMYAGQFVEIGPTRRILDRKPLHPYTAGLLLSHPGNGLHPLPGKPPGLHERRHGCRFSNRCSEADPRCRHGSPPLKQISENHWVRCFHA